MDRTPREPSPPIEVRIERAGGETVYELDPERYALPTESGDERAAAVGESGSFEVRAGRPDPAREPEAIPVYRLGPDGPVAVPSGRVHVRTRSDRGLRSLAGPIEGLGFRIREIHAYAPFAGWIEPLAGGIPFALAHWREVRDLDGVEHAEPQMLREAGSRELPTDQ